MRYLIVLLLAGCATEFTGGATSDYRMAPVGSILVKDGGAKAPCQAATAKIIGKTIILDC